MYMQMQLSKRYLFWLFFQTYLVTPYLFQELLFANEYIITRTDDPVNVFSNECLLYKNRNDKLVLLNPMCEG